MTIKNNEMGIGRDGNASFSYPVTDTLKQAVSTTEIVIDLEPIGSFNALIVKPSVGTDVDIVVNNSQTNDSIPVARVANAVTPVVLKEYMPIVGIRQYTVDVNTRYLHLKATKDTIVDIEFRK